MTAPQTPAAASGGESLAAAGFQHDAPHDFQHDGDTRFPDFCVCGRIRSIGGYSPVHTDNESDNR